MPEFVATKCRNCGHIARYVKCQGCGGDLIYEDGEIKCSRCSNRPVSRLEFCSGCGRKDVGIDFMPMH